MPHKGVFFGFAATVTIGLALASWYVGVRIVAADEVPSSPAPLTTPVNLPAPPEPQAAQAAAAENSIAEAYWYSVPPADVYLQVAGLGPKQDTDFAVALQAKGFHAQVQMQDGASTRILIGPFSTRTQMELEQRKLQSQGILAVETSY
jgi:cell division protein FtsN